MSIVDVLQDILGGICAPAFSPLEDQEDFQKKILSALGKILPTSAFVVYLRYRTENLQRKVPFADYDYDRPLWASENPTDAGKLDWRRPNEPNPVSILSIFDAMPEDWSFWRDWYQGFLDGEPFDWELQRRVMNIDDAIWESGPEAVAKEIERIRAAFEVEQRAAELEEIATTVARAQRGIGDNNPPAPIEEALQTHEPITIIWAAARDLREEAQSDTPNIGAINTSVNALIHVAKSCGIWGLKKMDLGADAAIKAVGTTIGLGVGAWIIQYGDKLLHLIEWAKN